MNDIVKFLIGTTGVSAILIFLGKYTLNFLRDIGIEKYKNELSKETYKFQSDLNKKMEKFKISYSNVFVEQIVIIKETYKRLIKAEKPLEYLLRPVKFGPIKPEEEVAKEVIERANELFDYFDENELIFSEKSSETFNLIRKKYIEVWNVYSTKQFMGTNISGELLVKIVNELQEAYQKTLQGEMQILKKSLRQELQKQLGILEEEFSTKLSNEEKK